MAQPRPSEFAGGGRIDLREGIEQSVDLGGGNTDARIRDLKAKGCQPFTLHLWD